MAQKDFAHGTDLVGHQSTLAMNRRRILLAVIGMILVLALAVTIATLRPTANQTSPASTVRVVPYGNALEMQYARPWLDAEKHKATTIPYSNALYLHPILRCQRHVRPLFQ